MKRWTFDSGEAPNAATAEALQSIAYDLERIADQLEEMNG